MPSTSRQTAQAPQSQVRIEPAGWVCTASPSQSILQAAQQAGIELPSSCRNGTCRTCLSQLISGEIGYLIEWPGVSAEEKRDGQFLPCVACAHSDIVIGQPLAHRVQNSTSPRVEGSRHLGSLPLLKKTMALTIGGIHYRAPDS